jgi:hypothetical protein
MMMAVSRIPKSITMVRNWTAEGKRGRGGEKGEMWWWWPVFVWRQRVLIVWKYLFKDTTLGKATIKLTRSYLLDGL